MSTLLRVGSRCAGYQILYLIGAGEQAEVYAATGPDDEDRALKLVLTDEGLAAKVHARIAQEGVALTQIVHSAIVRFYEAGVWEDRVWLSLELVEGDTLRQLLAKGPVPIETLIDWMQQACDGIAEAHRVGVIHRGLTPEDILITEDGKVKVIDFGLAKLRGHGVKTTAEQRIGNAMYMAPEQMRQKADAAPGMDV